MEEPPDKRRCARAKWATRQQRGAVLIGKQAKDTKMDYALIISGAFILTSSGMVDVAKNFRSRLLFRAGPIVAAMVPIIAGLDGLQII